MKKAALNKKISGAAAAFALLILLPSVSRSTLSCRDLVATSEEAPQKVISPTAKLYAKAMARQKHLADHGITIKFGARYENGGFPIFRLDRINYWTSLYRLDDNGHGDPRFFSSIMGRNAAAYFGHLVASNDSVYVPGALFLNRSIARYNEKRLPEQQIAVSFFATENVAFENKAMVRAWASDARYPLAESGYYQVHDASFHHLAIILPLDLVTHSQKIYRLLDDFWSTLAQKNPELLKKINLSESTYYAFLAKQIDALGNLHMLGKDLSIFRPYFFARFLFDGKTSEQALIYTFLEKYRHDSASDLAMRDQIEEFLKSRGNTKTIEQLLHEAPSYKIADVRRLIVVRRNEIRRELHDNSGSLTLE